jgi:DNA mismatch repair ATPase MutS
MLIKSGTSFISATHLHELIKMESIKSLNKMGVYHISVRYDNDNIIFDRQLLKGNGKEEYGLDFAKYLINDNTFNEISLDVKNELENNKFRLSRYNSNLIVEKCEICKFRNSSY